MSFNSVLSTSNSNNHSSASTNTTTLTNENFEMNEVSNSTTMKIDDEANLSPNGDSFIDSRNNIENGQVLHSNETFDDISSVEFNKSNLKANGNATSNGSIASCSDNEIRRGNELFVPTCLSLNRLSNSISNGQANGINSHLPSISQNITTESISEPKPNSCQSNQSNLVNGHSPIRNGSISTSQLNALVSAAPLTKSILANGHGSEKSLKPPYPLLAGEILYSKEELTDGFVYLTNYRLYVDECCKPDESLQKNYQQQQQEQLINLPVGVIDSVEIRDISFLVVFTKYVQSFILSFQTGETATVWHKRLSEANNIKADDSFCFKFFSNLSLTKSEDNRIDKLLAINQEEMKLLSDPQKFVQQEFKRMNFDKSWKICELNKDFKFCNTYPQNFILPSEMSDKDLDCVANFRYSRRIPVVVWRSQKNGCVIARSSQPVVGWLGWRSQQDERLLHIILNICNRDTQKCYKQNNDAPPDLRPTFPSGFSSPHKSDSSSDLSAKVSNDVDCNGQVIRNGHATSNGSLPVNHSMEKLDEVGNTKKLLILDARSYTAALANRAMGGGCEYAEYYVNCDVQFMGLNNIHNIRKSFHALRYICESAQIDQPNWFTMLDNTKWFHNIAALLKVALVVVDSISIHERPVLVHCSDGWDRTPQVVALAELMLDPYYRTIEGFKVLIEREWLQFGHKFTDRGRSSTLNIDLNERCPVFLQWLDCVHQLLRQFPSEFEFNDYYLIKLVYHSYSSLFGTFTCNNVQERTSLQLYERTISIWSYLHLEKNIFTNYLFIPKQEILRPSCRVKDIVFWDEVYVPVSSTSVASIIPYNEICSNPVNNKARMFVNKKTDFESGMWNEANIDESRIEFDCSHEIKCQSQSKCDLNRWASYENVSSKMKNMSTADHLSNGLSKNALQTLQIFDPDVRPRIRHLSDSCIYRRKEKPIDRDNFLSSSIRNNDSICDTEQDCSNMDSLDKFDGADDKKRDEPVSNGNLYQCPQNGRARKMIAKDVRCNENSIDHNGDSLAPELSNHFNMLPVPCLSSNLAKPFDIDGQILVKDKSYLHAKQMIIYHQKMINSLTEQLKEALNDMKEPVRSLRSRSKKSNQIEDSTCSRKHSNYNVDYGNKHLDALDLNSFAKHNLNGHILNTNRRKVCKDALGPLHRPRSMTEGRTSDSSDEQT